MGIELRSLELLLKVAELGSISLAAEAVGMRQPSATDRLNRMERELGLALFRRSPRGTALTADGVAVAGWAEEVLAAAARLTHGVEALRDHHKSHLEISSSMTVAEHLIPPLLAELRNEVPDIRVAVRVCNSQQVVRDVSSGRVELGFIGTRDYPDDLCGRVLVNDPLVLVVPETHRWAHMAFVDIRDLMREPLVVHERGAGTRETFDQALASLGLGWTHDPQLELGSTATIKAAVAQGQGVGVVSRLTVSDGGEDPRLRIVGIAGADVDRCLRLLWKRTRRLSPPSQTLVEVATRGAADLRPARRDPGLSGHSPGFVANVSSPRALTGD